jgi:hypothetical protein
LERTLKAPLNAEAGFFPIESLQRRFELSLRALNKYG